MKNNNQLDLLYFEDLNSWNEIRHCVHKFGNILAINKMKYGVHT